MNEMIDKLKTVADELKEMTNPYKSIVNELNDMTQPYRGMIDIIKSDIGDMFSDMYEGLFDVWHEIENDIANGDSSEWKAYQDAMSTWGKYGWTLPPDAIFPEFYNAPNDKVDADIYMARYCTDESVLNLKEQILEMDICDTVRFGEACDCYQAGYYTGCASILCALIDSCVGMFAGYSTKDKKYPIGKAARENLKKKLIGSARDHVINLYANTMSCLETVFSKADPMNLPDVINRNLLMHGFWNKAVEDKDCIQLMLLYWHVMWLIRNLNWKTNENDKEIEE